MGDEGRTAAAQYRLLLAVRCVRIDLSAYSCVAAQRIHLSTQIVNSFAQRIHLPAQHQNMPDASGIDAILGQLCYLGNTLKVGI